MKGTHHGRPADHEHARCRFCGRPDVHVVPVPDSRDVTYSPHAVPGDGNVACRRSRYGKTVWPEDRHQQITDDEETP